jgi:putative CocE/NonD family hydrolase
MHDVVIDQGVAMTTRDGVELVADVYRPDADGRFPTLVVRTPYGRNVPLASSLRDAEFFSRHGYVVVHQDTRGRGDSSGTFYPFLTEGADTFDTIEWAATLRCSNGDVATVGQSYMALVQYLGAVLRPPHLRAIVPVAGPLDMYDHCVYRGGAFELQWMINYLLALELNTYARAGAVDDVERLRAYREMDPTHGGGIMGGLPETVLRHLPVLDWGDRLCGDAPYVREMLENPHDGPFWWRMSATFGLAAIDVPAFIISSWYDMFLEGAIRAYEILTDPAVAHPHRRDHRLLIGPWGHLGSPQPYSVPTTGGAGDYDFGPAAAVRLHDIQLEWLDARMKGSGHVDTGPRVRLFAIGENAWRSEDSWPPVGVEAQPFYLHSRGSANGMHGDGVLSEVAPDPTGGSDTFVYDPADPVPTIGGVMGGIRDQRDVEARSDVLVYTSGALSRPLEVTGRVRADVFVSTDAVATDFTAKLVDVRPDGYAHNLGDGVVRLHVLDGTGSRGGPVGPLRRISIDLGATSMVFEVGHRIRLEISSSNFPRFDRNLNTGVDPMSQGDAWVQARQTVHHSAGCASALVLPVRATPAG